jgi:hypothetical protein
MRIIVTVLHHPAYRFEVWRITPSKICPHDKALRKFSVLRKDDEGREYWEYREPTPKERAEIKAELEGAL